MKHIVIDFEMQHGEMQLLQSAPNVYQTEIIEIGAVMLNDEFEFVSEFKSYVHPSYGKLSDNIAILTGIKDSDIRDAPLISEAVSSLFAWIATVSSLFMHGARLITPNSAGNLPEKN